MPPLFVYAVAFLSFLAVVGFVVCLRDGVKAAEPEVRPGVEASRPQRSLEAGQRLAGAGNAAPSPRASAPGGTSWPERPIPPAASRAVRWENPIRPGAEVPRPAVLPGAGSAALRPFDHNSDPVASQPFDRSVPPHGAGGDGLAAQVAHLAEQVAELKAERRVFEEEVRRLQRVVRDAEAALGDLTGARAAKPRGASANVRYIDVHDLRVKRVS